MKLPITSLLFVVSQMNAVTNKPVVIHLRPHHDYIDADSAGKLLELANAPAVIHLPNSAPKSDLQGNAWSVDVKNLGPSKVTITSEQSFRVEVKVNETVHISSDGRTYRLTH